MPTNPPLDASPADDAAAVTEPRSGFGLRSLWKRIKGPFQETRPLSARTALQLRQILDDSARGALFEALETARMAQKAIQQRLAKPLRKEAYANANLTRLVEATSDRDLFRRWGQSDDFVLPLSFLDEPRSLEGPADGIDVKVVTESGGKVPMHRDEDGFWRVGGFRPAVEKVLIEPAKRALQPSP